MCSSDLHVLHFIINIIFVVVFLNSLRQVLLLFETFKLTCKNEGLLGLLLKMGLIFIWDHITIIIFISSYTLEFRLMGMIALCEIFVCSIHLPFVIL